MTPDATAGARAAAGATVITWRRHVVACGFSWRKRALVREFTGLRDVRFGAVPPQADADTDLLLWGSTPVPAGVSPMVRVVRVEDGFLRSVGLGADLVRPVSWVLDTRSIYYDARSPSDLEELLEHGEFSPQLLRRAQVLRQQIVQTGLSKYNLGGTPWRRPDTARQVVLVIGQVETDASIATGTLDIRSNMALLRAVRQARPDAWLLYKPHPDVEAGLRGQGAGEENAAQWADEVLTGGAVAQTIPLVDELHVMTSLAGFEALLRAKPVFCYGQPFYAGWGLTQDRHAHPRRTRKLELDALVAAALLQYPVYLGSGSRQRCTPEQALQDLLAMRDARSGTGGQVAWWRRLVRPLLSRP